MNKQNNNDNVNDLVKLSFFTDIGIAITSTRSMKKMLERVMEKIGTIFVPLNWSLLLRNSKTGELTFKIAVGESADKLLGVKIPKGDGIVGWIAETGKSVIIKDVSKDERFIGNVDKITGFSTESIIGVPLKVNGKVFGVIELINKLNGKSFSPYELKLLQTIADFAAVALEKFYYLKAIQKVASMDGLTEVLNRRSFDQSLLKEIERCKRYNHPLSVIMLDINNFKQINDRHGHPAGDQVLKETAGILRNNVRLVDSVFRYGGDEFVILMPDTTLEEAEIVRSRITLDREKLNNQEGIISVTYSIGLHSAGPDGVDDIISNSDLDLYRQKDIRKENNFENLNDHVEEFLDEEE
ncbi:MAG: sensor domain-containing diguanylate cyclase [Spirochaetales bacterium]|nr:sensor domain-containing diguanylate cyclase [Spirochaetales bacterium]